LVLHVPAGHDVSALVSGTAQILKGKGLPKLVVKTHGLRRLAFPRSLESWLKRLDVEEIIHDPTKIVRRGRLLISAAKACRARFGQAISQIMFDPATRAVFVRVRKAHNALKLQGPIAQAIEGSIRAEGSSMDWCANVRVVGQLPTRPLIPVDSSSARPWRNVPDLVRKLGLSAIAAVSVASFPAVAHSSGALDAASPEKGVRAPVSTDYGLLFGLSVFSDGQLPSVTSAFTSSGLDLYFAEGEHVSKGWRFAERKDRRRRRDPEEVGQIGGGGGGGGGGPGS
jgi:hypothetical protein